MAYVGPWSNFHELNLDWLLRETKQLRTDVNGMMGASTPSDDPPEMDGIADPGLSVNYSRGDHRHPTDTSRAAAGDLTQEITDRGNADLALAGDIATVDAKIKLSNTAPLMDDSSATAGVSDYMARADHVHPTDTSRASKSEFDTLKATVDGMSGSASPYDVAPLMDGVASYGTVGAYSRGDHVHPSDSTKLNVSGGTVTGRIVELRKERYVTKDSVGWLRVADCPNNAGSMVRIRVVRQGSGTPAECHAVTLCVNQNSWNFIGEESEGNVLYIDKIRITDAGKIDIHMDQAYESYIGIQIEAISATDANTALIQALSISDVADAPAGESVLALYSFHQYAGYDPIVEIGSDASWSWTKYASGLVEMRGLVQMQVTINTATGALFYNTTAANVTIPVALTNLNDPTAPPTVDATSASGNLVFIARAVLTGANTIELRFLRAIAYASDLTIPVYFRVTGKYI